MKKSVEFLKRKLKILVKICPFIKCEYEYFDFDNTHFIKIFPKSIYEKNKTYIKFEREIVREFIDKFPYEGISFISGNDFSDLFNPTIAFEGEFYKMTNLEQIYTEINSDITVNVKIKIPDYSEDTYKLNIPTNLDINKEIRYLEQIDYLDEHSQDDFFIDLNNDFSLAA